MRGADIRARCRAQPGVIPRERMKIAYVTTYDARDVRQWSGLGRHIAKSLEDQGCALEYIGPFRQAWGAWFKAKHALVKYLLRKGYTRDRQPAIVRDYARQVERRLVNLDVDVVLGPGTIPLSLVNCRAPIVYWADATFAGMLGFYPDYSNLSGGSVRNGLAMETEAFRRCALAIFASRWAADSAVRGYGLDPAKVKVVPFGANLAEAPSPEAVEQSIANRPLDRCKLLFVGVEWERKGGDIVLETARILNELGMPAEVVIVGAAPPRGLALPEFARVTGYIDKSSAAGRGALAELFGSAHFLLMPSRAEAYGLAPAEANAFGVPALTSDSGGLTTVIREGCNGFALPVGSPASEYARRILELMGGPDRYRALCRSARSEYESRLNWTVAGREVRGLLDGLGG
jgi:glycosyltransferase involved in cell wall biosynthesis